MIQLIEAPPRSGKSYFAVNYLVRFTQFDELYNEYILDKNVLIISNIEGLKIRHWSLNYCLGLSDDAKLHQASNESIQKFFTIENFEQIMKKTGKNHVILCIDEVHELFPSGYKDQKVYEFFAYHGHIGLDVIFMTQGIESMSRMFNPLLEFVVKVTPRSKKVYKTFTYKYYTLKGLYLYSKVLTQKQEVFRAYKSFRQDEHQKPKSALLNAVIMMTVLLVAGVGMFKFAFGVVEDKSVKARERSVAMSATVKREELTEEQRRQREQMAYQKSAVVGDAVPSESDYKWRIYPVDGFIEKGQGVVYLIHGKVFNDSPRFRNFDRDNRLIEYLGYPIEAGAGIRP